MPSPSARAVGLLAAALGLSSPAPAAAVEVFHAGASRLFVGGDFSVSMAEKDRGYFNDHDYGQNALRAVRTRLTAELRVGAHVAALGELRHENEDHPRVYALYVRLRPWRKGPLDIQAGQIPHVFGAYTRRTYAADNPLIGEPLAYQYLTALRADAAPSRTRELLEMRGRGWQLSYPLGNTDPAAGLPAMNARHWDTGLEMRLRFHHFDVAAAITQGSPSSPRFPHDDNDGKCLSARLSWWPVPGLIAGVSAARGRYVEDRVEELIGVPRVQRLAGADLEYSRGRWQFRAETVLGSWDAPIADPTRHDVDLEAWAAMLEMRVKVMSGLSVAARGDRLTFGDVPALDGALPWDYAVTRGEAGVVYVPLRHVQLKASFQHNRRDGGRVRRQSFVAGQVLLWF